MTVLITAEELTHLLASEEPPVLLDVRWRLGGPPGRGEYVAGHLPGAVFVDLEADLSRPGEPTEGRHPLPDPESFEQTARRWGVSPGRLVVAYDDNGNQAAARAWWLLRWAGHTDVRLLDGGLGAWLGALETAEPQPRPGTFTVAPGRLPVLDLEDVQAFDGVLVDARAGERYRGETEPIDPKAGHIPGAVSVPTAGNLGPDGRFLPADDLRERFAAAGITADTAVAAYCGSGVTAAHEVAALQIAGIDAALYPGSWSQWSNLDLPVATGEERPGRS